MDTYTAVKNRILFLCDQKHMTINKLATASAVAPSTIKNILYGKSHNPGIVTCLLYTSHRGSSSIAETVPESDAITGSPRVA